MQFKLNGTSNGILICQNHLGWHFSCKMGAKTITNAKEYISPTPEEAFQKAMIWWQQESTS